MTPPPNEERFLSLLKDHEKKKEEVMGFLESIKRFEQEG
jgi:hypothetical protein